jgi:hypothetical protein
VINADVVYFLGASSGIQQQLWRTDGTACGTFEVLGDGNPSDLTLSNGQIYMAYTHEQFGRELFVMEEDEISVPCSATTAAASRTKVLPRNADGNGDEHRVVNYPNPFKTEFVLNVAGKEGDSFHLSIRDVKGADASEPSELSFNHDHNVGATLRPGIYLLHIQKRDGMIVKKMIKTD